MFCDSFLTECGGMTVFAEKGKQRRRKTRQPIALEGVRGENFIFSRMAAEKETRYWPGFYFLPVLNYANI